MLEFLERLSYWLSTPNYESVVRRHLAYSKLQYRQALSNAHYNSLMAQFHLESIKRDEKLLQNGTLQPPTFTPTTLNGSPLKEELS